MDVLQDTAERVARRELNWDIKRIVPQDEDEDGRWYYVTDGCRVAAICVPDDKKYDGYVAEHLSYRVAKYGDHSTPTFGVFTSREMAEGEAEAHSDGTEDIWAVYDITDIYPRVVALAHYGVLYSRDWEGRRKTA
jgi:hypothetical protein